MDENAHEGFWEASKTSQPAGQDLVNCNHEYIVDVYAYMAGIVRRKKKHGLETRSTHRHTISLVQRDNL